MTSILYYHMTPLRIPLPKAYAYAWIGGTTGVRLTVERAAMLELEARERNEKVSTMFIEHPYTVEFRDGDALNHSIDTARLEDALDISNKSAYIPIGWKPGNGRIVIVHQGLVLRDQAFSGFDAWRDRVSREYRTV